MSLRSNLIVEMPRHIYKFYNVGIEQGVFTRILDIIFLYTMADLVTSREDALLEIQMFMRDDYGGRPANNDRIYNIIAEVYDNIEYELLVIMQRYNINPQKLSVTNVLENKLVIGGE